VQATGSNRQASKVGSGVAFVSAEMTARSIHAVARCFDPTQRSSLAPLRATTLRLRQQIVVLSGTGSIGHRERRKRIVKGVALSNISRDHGRIGRTRVRAGERAPAQAGVVYEGILLDDLANRPEPPVFQMAHVEVPARHRIFRPAEEDVARGLHGPLPFDDAPPRVPVEFWPEAFEYRFSGLLELKEQWRAVAAREQAHGAKRAHASDPDDLKGGVFERVSLKQAQPLRRQTLLVGRKYVDRIDVTPWVALLLEMIYRRWLVGDLAALDQMREVVVLLDPFARLGDDRMKPTSESLKMNRLLSSD
jgi:hypothetical protein